MEAPPGTSYLLLRPRGHDDHVIALALLVHAARRKLVEPAAAISLARDAWAEGSRY